VLVVKPKQEGWLLRIALNKIYNTFASKSRLY
jgi:hypothetical protein